MSLSCKCSGEHGLRIQVPGLDISPSSSSFSSSGRITVAFWVELVRRITRLAYLPRCQRDPSLIASQPGGGDRFFYFVHRRSRFERSVTLESLCYGIGFGALRANFLICVLYVIVIVMFIVILLFCILVAISMENSCRVKWRTYGSFLVSMYIDICCNSSLTAAPPRWRVSYSWSCECFRKLVLEVYAAACKSFSS